MLSEVYKTTKEGYLVSISFGHHTNNQISGLAADQRHNRYRASVRSLWWSDQRMNDIHSSSWSSAHAEGGVVETRTLLLVVVVIITSASLATFFPDRDLNALGCKALAEICAVTNTWKLLGRVDLEDVTEH